MKKDFDNLRNRVALIEKQITDLMNKWRKNTSMSDSETIQHLKENDYSQIETLLNMFIIRKTYLDHMFRETNGECQLLKRANSFFREKTEEIDEVAERTFKELAVKNDGALNDIEVKTELVLPLEAAIDGITDEEQKFYGSDFHSMIKLECIVNAMTMHNIETSIFSSEKRSMASDYNTTNTDWKTPYTQWIETEKAGEWCHTLHIIEDKMNFPLIDIIHLTALEIQISINGKCLRQMTD